MNRDAKFEEAVEFAIDLFTKMRDAPRCATCGLTKYEHIDHVHVENCAFGDCGDYLES